MKPRQLLPAQETRTEITVVNSHFIATIAPAFSVAQAKTFIARIREEFADASHNVPAFVVGHGSSVISHCNDDGEPAGTAGRPALAVLQGSGMGDAVVVITRYFGGTKLGKGGLVRAYGDAVRAVLDVVPRAEKVCTHRVLLAMPYPYYERVRLLITNHQGIIQDETFAGDVTLSCQFKAENFPQFQKALQESSHGSLEAEIIATDESTIMPFPIES